MEDKAPVAPAGWYPDPNGTQRFWDGSHWLALPPPDSAESTSSNTSTATFDAKPPRKISRKTLLIMSSGLALLLLLGAGGVIWKVTSDAHAADVAAAAEAELKTEEAAAKQAAEKAQQRKDDEERAARTEAVKGIEKSIKEMAEKHVTEGILDGPIISASCSPLGGGSTDDLTESTTVFTCFVGSKDNDDGTMSGYTYNATMNWSTGSYTYGLGAP